MSGVARNVTCLFTESGQGGLLHGHVLGKRRPRVGSRWGCANKEELKKKRRKTGREEGREGGTRVGGREEPHISTSLNTTCDDWQKCLCGPFWATWFLYFSLRALMSSLAKGKTGGVGLIITTMVLPFSFPFFVFLVMPYLHFYPTTRRRCHFCSLTPSLSTSFPKAAVRMEILWAF